MRFADELKELVVSQVQYLYDTYGKFPATVPSIFLLTYIQAQHIDLDFHDHYSKTGAHLNTHKYHMMKGTTTLLTVITNNSSLSLNIMVIFLSKTTFLVAFKYISIITFCG